MATFSRAAAELSGSFVSQTRSDESSYVCLGSDSPEWMKTAVMLAHDGESPNDGRYELIRWAAVALSEQQCSDSDEANEALLELSRDLVPAQTAQLLSWFSENLSRLGDCDEAAEEQNLPEQLTVTDLLSLGYQRAAESVLSILISEIEENRLSVFDSDYDCRLLLSDSHGVYIPQLYCENISKSEAKEMSLDWWAVETCQHGPSEEHYWDAWQSILDSAEITEPATLKEDESLWNLHQNGDLWMVRSGVELPSYWNC
jgi:hypothetical protein